MRLILACVFLFIIFLQASDITITHPPSAVQNLEIHEDKFGIQGGGFSSSGYSELELNNKTFQQNEIDTSLWRAVAEYRVFYEFHPFTHTSVNLFFGTSLEITQYRTGGKTKTYNDGIYREDNSYDWGGKFYYGGRVNKLGITININGLHKFHIVIRQAFIDDFNLGAVGLPFANTLWVDAQNAQLSLGGSRTLQNTQILLTYDFVF
ncbi:hypothetical protein [uncultured Helicobacter sp.]|uniref:hypothetical protein n=1 Tax=uncultured Helicobacter sp. TaxID=175537 RepID=UPI003751572E